MTPVFPSLEEALSSTLQPEHAVERWLNLYDWSEIPYASRLFPRVVIFRLKTGGPLHAVELGATEPAHSGILRWGTLNHHLELV